MSVHVTRFLTLASLRVILIAMFTGSAFSATFAVGSCSTLVNFATIQHRSMRPRPEPLSESARARTGRLGKTTQP